MRGLNVSSVPLPTERPVADDYSGADSVPSPVLYVSGGGAGNEGRECVSGLFADAQLERARWSRDNACYQCLEGAVADRWSMSAMKFASLSLPT